MILFLIIFEFLFLLLQVITSNNPNIIIYITDDLGIGGIGGPIIETPYLSRFKNESLVMTHTYSNGLCAPSRWELLTGSNEVDGNGLDGIIKIPNITLPKVLKKLGYVTGVVGKYGHGGYDTEGSATKMGFDYSYIYPTHKSAHYLFPEFLEKNGKVIRINKKTKKLCCKTCIYSPDLFLSESMKFIDNNHNNNNIDLITNEFFILFISFYSLINFILKKILNLNDNYEKHQI